MSIALIDASLPTRHLMRSLRRNLNGVDDALPESLAWQTYLELRRRGEPDANEVFLKVLKNLHSRRCIAGVELPNTDSLPNEHRLTEDAFLADLWKAYKKCIANNRTGPASQLLRDIEEHIAAA